MRLAGCVGSPGPRPQLGSRRFPQVEHLVGGTEQGRGPASAHPSAGLVGDGPSAAGSSRRDDIGVASSTGEADRRPPRSRPGAAHRRTPRDARGDEHIVGRMAYRSGGVASRSLAPSRRSASPVRSTRPSLPLPAGYVTRLRVGVGAWLIAARARHQGATDAVTARPRRHRLAHLLRGVQRLLDRGLDDLGLGHGLDDLTLDEDLALAVAGRHPEVGLAGLAGPLTTQPMTATRSGTVRPSGLR